MAYNVVSTKYLLNKYGPNQFSRFETTNQYVTQETRKNKNNLTRRHIFRECDYYVPTIQKYSTHIFFYCTIVVNVRSDVG